VKHQNPRQTFFFANSFLRRNGWKRSAIFAYTSETAGTQFRPIWFPASPTHLTLVFFSINYFEVQKQVVLSFPAPTKISKFFLKHIFIYIYF
jgi:hypothetical protein